MPNFDIDSYRANFQGGARQNLFYVKPMFPGAVGGNADQATYLVRSSTIPETVTEEVMTQWQGFDFKMASKYTFPDWMCTFNVDLTADIHKWFLQWATVIHDPVTNVYKPHSQYMADQTIQLLGFDGAPILTFTLIGAWVKQVGNITLDYSSTDVAQFEVTWSYLYHKSDKVSY
jgi:hypothetical protein